MQERAAFIHSYLSDKDKGGNPIPDRPTRMGILAAAELKRHNKVDTIALSVVPELSGPIVKRLKILLHNSLDENGFVSTEATATTKGEVKVIKQLSEENNWGEVISIVIDPHKERVEKNVERVFGEKQKTVTVKTFNEVLSTERSDALYDKVIGEAKSWHIYREFEKQEARAQKLSKIPIVGEFLVYEFPDLLPEKIKIWIQKWLLKNS